MAFLYSLIRPSGTFPRRGRDEKELLADDFSGFDHDGGGRYVGVTAAATGRDFFDGLEHVLAAVGGRLHHGCGAGKRHHAHAHFARQLVDEGARGFLDSIPALRNRECIICGEGVSIPIRVAFDDLEEMKRPASADPSISELWRDAGGEEEMVLRTVQRWRAQGR